MKKAISVMLCVVMLMTACCLSSVVSAAGNNIDGIEINGVDVAIGGTPNADAVSVPAGAKYKITGRYWQDNNSGATNVSQFTDLRKYTLNLTIEADEGYSIDAAPYIKVNGKEHKNASIVQYDRKLLLSVAYSFRKSIQKVELPALPTAAPMGETYTYDRTVENQALVETEAYTVTGGWRQYVPGQGTTGDFVFKEGAMYVYKMWVYAKDGYEITDSTVFTAGGKTVSRDSIYHYFSDENATICQLFNHSSLKPISTVDITVGAPTIGHKIDAQAKTSAAGVTIDSFLIQETATANIMVPREMGNTMLALQSTSGNYIANKQYLAKGYITAANGYYFAADLTIRVNGKEASTFPSLADSMLDSGSPTSGNAFILLLGKSVAPTTTTTTAKPTQAKPTTTATAAPTDDQSDIGEPTDAETVSDPTTESTAPVDDPITDVETEPDADKGGSVLTIVLAIVGGVVLLGGGAAGVLLWLKKKRA